MVKRTDDATMPTTRDARHRLALVCSIGAAAAMIAALAFVARVLMVRHLAHDFANVSRDYLWMTPLGYLILFGAAAIPVLLIAHFLSARNTAWLCTWLFTALVIFDSLMPVTSIGRVAVVVLAGGVGAVVARNAVRRLPYLVRGMTFVASAIALGLAIAAVLNRRRAEAPVVVSSNSGLPNVLVLILDTVRADAMGTYGYYRGTTPRIDALASQSVVFESAMATASWTLPSHASMFTGRYPSSLSADYKVPLDARDSTLAEVLAVRGYDTAGFVANVWYTSWESGLSRGFHVFDDYQRSLEQIIKSTHLGRTDLTDELLRSTTLREAGYAVRRLGLQEVPRPQPARKPAALITDDFLAWHADRDQSRPYFAFLNYFDVHDPYEPVEPYRSRFAADTGDATPRDRYDAELAYLDEHVGRLIDRLAERNDLANTLVVLTADHGEHFGERNQLGHFNSIYMPLIHVPLMMRFDGRLPAGRRIERVVSLRDLAATIMALVGQASPLPGTSLVGALADETEPVSAAASSHALTRGESLRELNNGMLSLVEEGWHYMLTGRKEHEELYRWREDPREASNLVGSDSARTRIPAMRSRLMVTLEGDRGAPGLPRAR